MAEIQVRKKSEEPGAASLAVTVPPESVREAEERAVQAYRRRARLPGFRKGKAPAALVRRQFAEDIRQQALEAVVRESWRVAVRDQALKPVGDPQVHNLKWEEGRPITFEFHVELRPEIRLQRLGGFRLTRTIAPVTPAQVEQQLQGLREQRAPWAPVTGERPVRSDQVHVTIGRRADGAVSEPEPHNFVLGEGRAIPEVEERIMALLPGETVDATVRFPDDFPDEAKRGQARDIRITLHEVKRQALAPLDDAFAHEVGDFDSLEALRAAIREDLGRDAERDADARVRGELVEQLVAANNVVAPRPLVDRAVAVYAQAYGVPEERWPQFAAEFRPLAEAQVRRDLVLDAVVDAHHLAATAAEVDAKIEELARRRGLAPAELRASLEKAGRLRDVERGLTEQKVFDYLLSQSTVEPA